MRRKIIKECLKIAYAELPTRIIDFKHWTFIIQDNEIVTWGKNVIVRTPHTYLGYDASYQFLHSEPDALNKASGLLDRKKYFSALNIRLWKNRRWAFSKPCEVCGPLLKSCGCSEVLWTTNQQTLEGVSLDSNHQLGCSIQNQGIQFTA